MSRTSGVSSSVVPSATAQTTAYPLMSSAPPVRAQASG